MTLRRLLQSAPLEAAIKGSLPTGEGAWERQQGVDLGGVWDTSLGSSQGRGEGLRGGRRDWRRVRSRQGHPHELGGGHGFSN